MYLMKKVAVVLDLNESDAVVCDFVERIVSRIEFSSIEFIHVVKNAEIPKDLSDKYPDLITPLDETIKDAVQKTISDFTSICCHDNVNIHVLEGDKQKEIPKFAREHDLDLLVIDQGEEDQAHLNFLPKLTRNLTCDVAIVPATVPEDIRQLLVPIDFSKNSGMALQFAQLLASVDKNITIKGLHLYRVPNGYRKVGKTFEEFSEVVLENAKSEYRKFLDEYDVDADTVDMTFLLQSGDTIPTMINRYALSNKVDMILIGSRGRDTLSSFVLGSMAEQLITKEHYLPMVIVKNKGASLKLWEALLHL